MKRLSLFLGALALVVCLAAPAGAQEMLDLERKGSITVNMVFQGERVPGGSLGLYRVGDIAERNGSYFFQLNEDFQGSGADVSDPTKAETAKTLEEYAKKSGAEKTMRIVREDGTVVFQELEPGLYLVCQEKPAKGFNPIVPFLISVPMNESGYYVYEVDASPKVALTPAPTEPPTKPTYPDIPQTGQRVWPVGALGALGLALFGFGLLAAGKRRAA